MVRVDDRVSQRSARRGHASRVKSGRAVHCCIRSACRSHRCVGLCSVVVAVLADTADAVLFRTPGLPCDNSWQPESER